MGRTWPSLAFLGASLPALVLFDMAAVDERMSGGEWALGATEGLSRCVLEPLVEVEIVLAFAAVAAAVAVERPLAGVHAHMLDELVGCFGEVAALLTLIVVAQAVSARVPFQLCLIGPHSLADAAAILHLVVCLQVALHGGWPVGGVDAERAHLNSTFHLLRAPKRFTNLEPSSRDGVALLVLQELLGRLHELVADVTLKHARDQVDL